MLLWLWRGEGQEDNEKGGRVFFVNSIFCLKGAGFPQGLKKSDEGIVNFIGQTQAESKEVFTDEFLTKGKNCSFSSCESSGLIKEWKTGS